MRWGVYLVIVLLQLIVTFPRFLQTCEGLDAQRLVIYVGHHISDVYLFWSPLFVTTLPEALFHLMVVILIFIHWISYNNRCIVTVYLNQLCGYPEDVWFDSMLNRSALRNISDYYQFVWISVSVVLNFWLTAGK